MVEYKKDKDNLVADALSRKVKIEDFSPDGDDIEGVLCMVFFPTPAWLTELKASYGSGQKVQGIFQASRLGEEVPKGFSIQNGLLLYKGRIYLGSCDALKVAVLQ